MISRKLRCAPVASLLGVAIIAFGATGCFDGPGRPEIFVEADDSRASVSERAPHQPGEDAAEKDGDSPDYFPLHDGDFWAYVYNESASNTDGSPGMPQVFWVLVTGSYALGDLKVYYLHNYLFPLTDQQIEFYNEPPSRTVEVLNQRHGPWYPWWVLGSDSEVPILLPDFAEHCFHGSKGSYSRSPIGYTVPAGTFVGAAVIDYTFTPCSDVALAFEVFAPGVGLIERAITTRLGEMVWSLAYARVDGQTWGTPP